MVLFWRWFFLARRRSYGKEKRFSEFLGERTKRRGVWLVTALNVEEMGLLVGKTPGEVLFLMLVRLLGKEFTLGKRAGGVNTGTGAVGSVSGRKEPVWFLERLARKDVLRKRTKETGVQLVFSLDAKKTELLYELPQFECPRTCQRPESMLLYRSGLFRPLRSPVLHLEKV